MAAHAQPGRYEGPTPSGRLRAGLPVIDSAGTTIGIIVHIHRPDALAVGDDGRHIGEADDFASLLPGWTVHTLPRLAPHIAARLVRTGYLQIAADRRARQMRYAALTEIAEVLDDAVRLTVSADELPVDA